jgi:predicted lysophospholipase L1 biosynthesis ABC-type transport system permease subunit
VVINETFARKTFPGDDPIGKQLWVEVGPGEPIEKRTIIGVARDTKYGDIRDDFEPLVHLPVAQSRDGGAIKLLIKPRGRLEGVIPSLLAQIAQVNPEISVQTAMLEQTVRDGLVRERLMAALSSAFGILAGLLAAVGIYGVMSYTVTRRSSEIAIRLAMGASRSEVLRMVVVDGGWLIGVGLLIGAALSLGAAKSASALLFGLTPTDPVTIASAVAVLATIGLVACYVPARRAARVDPMNVLRQE